MANLRPREGWRVLRSRVSYFTEIKALDITIGQAGITPRNIVQAMGA
jgi:hypothetical protein